MAAPALGLSEKALPPELDFKERLQAAARAGFATLELSVDNTPQRLLRLEWGPSERRALRQVQEGTGVRIESICLSANRSYPLGSAHEELRRRGQEIIAQTIALACDLQITLVQIAGYDTVGAAQGDPSTADSARRFAEGLSEAAAKAERAGVVLGLENMDTTFINSIPKALYYVREVDSSALRLYPDVGNLCAFHGDPDAELRAGAPYIAALHLKDTQAVSATYPGRFGGVHFKAGCVPFARVFACLRELDLKVPLVLEMWHDAGGDPYEAAAQACRFVQEGLGAQT